MSHRRHPDHEVRVRLQPSPLAQVGRQVSDERLHFQGSNLGQEELVSHDGQGKVGLKSLLDL